MEETKAEIPPVPPKKLKSVQAVVTRKCNLACSYCNVRHFRDRQVDMNLETSRRVIQVAEKAPVHRLLMITGGEPFLVSDVTLNILENTSGAKVVFTNATLVTDEIARRMRRAGASAVVSLDGIEEVHDSSRCNSFHLVARGLDILRDNQVPYGLSAVVGSGNCSGIPQFMVRMHERFRPVSLGLNILHWTPSGFDPITSEEYSKALVDAFDTALSLGLFVDQIARRIDPLVSGRYRHRDCSATGEKVVFHPGGEVSNCISSQRINDWSGRIPFHMESCTHCPAAGICGGGCIWDAIHVGGGNPDPRHCTWTKAILHRFLDDVGDNFPKGDVSKEALRNRYGGMITRDGATLSKSLGHSQ